MNCNNNVEISFRYVLYYILLFRFNSVICAYKNNNMVSHIDPIYQIHSHMLIFGMQYCIQKDKQYSIGSAEF